MNDEREHARVIVLGSGPAGYTATLYAARANLVPLLVTGDEIGGQLLNTTQVENWPGDGAGVDGPALMQRMREHVERFEAKLSRDSVVSVDLLSKPFNLNGRERRYSCDALIIATGATALYLGLPSEKQFIGRGVSTCAVCDGLFYREQDVVVVGGGNTAVEEAMLLSQIAKRVTIIHRRDRFRAENILVRRLEEKIAAGTVQVLWNHIVDEVIGDETGVTGISVRELSDAIPRKFATQGLFVAIGHRPNTELFSEQLAMSNGYIVTKGERSNVTATSIPGVFAAGDVQDPVYRQAVTSAGSGCMAALDADRYLQSSTAL